MNSGNLARWLSFSDSQVFQLFEIQLLDSQVKIENTPEVISNSKIYSCERCAKLFSSQKKLNKHLQKQRSGMGNRESDENSLSIT